MAHVVSGRQNKQIAADLGVSEITVKVHRGQVMRKMRASSLPDLARMADQLRLKLTKPFREQDLLEAIQLGHARDRARLEQEQAMAGLKVRFETLTPREREVMAFVVTGRLNKQIAGDLGVSEITVKVHRGQVMRKMKASSLPDLARMADQLQLTPTKPHNPGRVA